MTLKLEVGKEYKNRNGETIKIVSDRGTDFTYRYVDQSYRVYDENGLYDYLTTEFDLVKLDQRGQTNPKDLIGITKPPLSLIPPALTIHAAMAFKYGGYEAKQKDGTLGYGPYNWRDKRVKAMIYIDAAMRHLNCFLDGEEYAEDSKVHHLAHIAACCGILLDAIEQGNLIDDRPTKGKAAEIIKRLTLDK